MHADPFSSMADDFDSGAASAAPVTQALYRETCRRCNGSGRYHRMSSLGTVCFKCNGLGYHEFKTSPEYRLKQRRSAADRKVRAEAAKAAEQAAKAQAWRDANPEAAEWINARAGRFDFATSMEHALSKWGTLTDGQLAAVTRCIEADKARKAEAEQRAAAAPAVENTALMEAFAKAKASGLKWPRITLGNVVISPAGDSSKNAGALYVKSDGEYLGKVMGGKFLRTRECSEGMAEQVAALIADPKAAAKAYGVKTGRCCLCSRELTDATSIENGIGPICERRFF